MKAVLLEGENQVGVRDVPAPDPAGRAVVQVNRAGVCGTDVKLLSGAVPVALPRVLGHEIVGTVQTAGPRGDPPEGTRVLVDPVIACGACDLCRRDRGNLCRNGALMGRDLDGGFAELFAVDERQLHPIPDTVSDDAAALLQVLATCIHAQRMVQVFPGQTAVVLGLGVSGQLHAQLLRARGLTSVIGVTRSRARRDLAARLGATAVAAPEDAAAVVEEATGGRGADLVVEAAGSPATLAQAVDLAGPGATVLGFGTITAPSLPISAYQLYYKELALVNARAAQPRDCAAAVELAAAGALELAPLHTTSFALDDAVAALEACRDDPAALKVSIQVSPAAKPQEEVARS